MPFGAAGTGILRPYRVPSLPTRRSPSPETNISNPLTHPVYEQFETYARERSCALTNLPFRGFSDASLSPPPPWIIGGSVESKRQQYSPRTSLTVQPVVAILEAVYRLKSTRFICQTAPLKRCILQIVRACVPLTPSPLARSGEVVLSPSEALPSRDNSQRKESDRENKELRTRKAHTHIHTHTGDKIQRRVMR